MRHAALAALALAVACASAPGPVRVTGKAAYRERMTLPPDAALRVVLVDVSLIGAPERVIAETEVQPAGQVPIPFALEVEPGRVAAERRYGLRASLVDAGGRVLFATPSAVAVLTQGAPATVELWLQRAAAPPGGTRVLAYDCDGGFAFRVELSAERAIVLLPGAQLALARVPSASGARYSDGAAAYWSRGVEATLDLNGAHHAGCRMRARPVP